LETYISNNGHVAKYVHDDSSETAIKTIAPGEESCGGSNRNKFNVFASCSVGCRIGCSFCFLQSKRYKQYDLTSNEISTNVVHAVEKELIRRPELQNTPMNISWMGMGDAFLDLLKIDQATWDIIRCCGLDVFEGVDIATTLPQIRYDDMDRLHYITESLYEKKVTAKPDNRTDVRIFYSLHSLNNTTRKKLIPRTLDLDIALPYLSNLDKKYNVIYHYMFLDYINDHSEDIENLIRMFSSNEHQQLRILRYNECPNSKFKETKYFNELIDHLEKEIPNLKVQLSPGSEIQAACGQFLMYYKGNNT
jgi:23S rRNA (adenine2503-C2)-methyltransferase